MLKDISEFTSSPEEEIIKICGDSLSDRKEAWNKLDPANEQERDDFYRKTSHVLFTTAQWHMMAVENAHRKMIAEKCKGKVLNFGCGIGTDGFYACYNSDVTEVDLYDLEDSIALKFADFRIKKHSVPKIKTVTLEELKQQKYDTIVCVDVLEHIENPEKIMELFKEVLAEDGKLLVEAPFYELRWVGHLPCNKNKDIHKMCKDAGITNYETDLLGRCQPATTHERKIGLLHEFYDKNDSLKEYKFVFNELEELYKEMGHHDKLLTHSPSREVEYGWAIRNAFCNKVINKGTRILDAGCGSSPLLLWLKRIYDIDDLTGLDKQVPFAEASNSLGNGTFSFKPEWKEQFGINYIEGDILTYKSKPYDYIFCISVLEHIYRPIDRMKAFSNMYTQLKPGGRLIITCDWMPNQLIGYALSVYVVGKVLGLFNWCHKVYGMCIEKSMDEEVIWSREKV